MIVYQSVCVIVSLNKYLMSSILKTCKNVGNQCDLKEFLSAWNRFKWNFKPAAKIINRTVTKLHAIYEWKILFQPMALFQCFELCVEYLRRDIVKLANDILKHIWSFTEQETENIIGRILYNTSFVISQLKVVWRRGVIIRLCHHLNCTWLIQLKDCERS